MGAPLKQELDYYPSYIIDYNSREFLKLKIKYNLLGLGVTHAIVKMIFENKETGFYIKWDDEMADDFCYINHIDKKTVNEIIQFLTGKHDDYGENKNKISYFDYDCFQAHNILTSTAIQHFYLFAKKRSKKILVDFRFFLLQRNIETDQEMRKRISECEERKKNLPDDRTKLHYCKYDNHITYLQPIMAQIEHIPGLGNEIYNLEDDPGVKELLRAEYLEDDKKTDFDKKTVCGLFEDLKNNLKDKGKLFKE